MKFRKDDGFDAQRFEAATRIFIIAQDIIVDRSSYPTEAITYNSHWFRTLGLGYANLGALLMSYGHPYASPKGLGLAKAITATLTGVAYRTSAELAASLAPFSGYHNAAHHGVSNPPEADNVASMDAVMQLHRAAINGLDKDCPQELKDFATKNWDVAIEMGKTHGYRNAQVTVLAPTGTIGFLMDCDTTGVEPAIGLVAYKTLAGGGLMTLPIRSIPLALENLNYEPATIEKVLNHIQEYGTIESIQSKDKTIHSGIRDEDIAIFDSAFASGRGQRSLPYMDHIKMMAAVQPFLSGAISKTVNMPKEATVEEIRKPISKHGVWVSKASLFIVMAQNVRLRLKLELTVKKQNLKYKLRPSLTVGNFPIRERP